LELGFLTFFYFITPTLSRRRKESKVAAEKEAIYSMKSVNSVFSENHNIFLAL
jgi:hypothetical protein